MKSNFLAWEKKADKDTTYTQVDLVNTTIVQNLFSACKHDKGYITADGWLFLFNHYGLNELLIIDLEVSWFDSSDLKNQKNSLIYHALMAGFNPFTNELGDYDTETTSFINLKGVKSSIVFD